MYLNQFSVRVPEGNESSGYVELEHDTQYTLLLRNNRGVRCDAKIEIDGKHVGTWRIEAHRNLRLERPAHDDGKFTFYKSSSVEARNVASDVGKENQGLLKVTFTPEKQVFRNSSFVFRSDSPDATFRYAESLTAKGLTASASSYESGVTGLSGKSNQQFTSVRELDYDYSQQTVIHLRLVARNNEPRPLTAYSTPVPPPVR